MHYHLTATSSNRKTGPIPVSTSLASTCPSTCPLLNQGCYAKTGPLSYHWQHVTHGRRGVGFTSFVKQIRQLPSGQVWRHNQAGDLAGKGNVIDGIKLRALVKANVNKRGFTYTHKPIEDHPQAETNRTLITNATAKGFTINVSANSLDQADRYKALQIAPVVVMLPMETPKTLFTAQGNKVIQCPAQYKERVTCASCKLCAIRDRKVIIGFAAHGSARRIVTNKLKAGTLK